MPGDNFATDSKVQDLKAIIFDFDGTLVDSEPLWKTTFFKVFKEKYAIELSDEILWENTGNGVDRSVQNISKSYDLQLSNDNVENITKALHEEMHALILSELPLREGAIELIHWADKSNIDMAICTASTNELIDEYFGQKNLRHFFKVVTSTAISEMDKRKPFPFPYFETMRLLNVQAQNTLAIEDSPSGVTSSVTAGIKTYAIQNPFLEDEVLKAGPTLLVKDFLQVLEHLSSS